MDESYADNIMAGNNAGNNAAASTVQDVASGLAAAPVEGNPTAPTARNESAVRSTQGANRRKASRRKAKVAKKVIRHKPKVAKRVRHPKFKYVPEFDVERERNSSIYKKEYKKKNDLISKLQIRFVMAGIPKNKFLDKSDIMCQVDPPIERILKVVVKKGGGGNENPVPFLNKLIYEVGLGMKEKYQSGNFKAGPFTDLTPEIVSKDILPRVEELLEVTKKMGLEDSLKFLSESLLRRLNDYNIEPQIPTEWDSDEDYSWKSEDTNFSDEWWNEESSLAGIEAIVDYGDFEELSDMEDE